MSDVLLSQGIFPTTFFHSTVNFILSCQQKDGAIVWFDGGCLDPWDHVEAAMGLSIGGEYDAAEKAYYWLTENQLADGSWWAAYKSSDADNGGRRESNFVAYIATGVWHHYLITKKHDFLVAMWPTIKSAIDFVIGLQSDYGDIYWAVSENDSICDDALVTGCCSIFKSLECACNIAFVLNYNHSRWLQARAKLGESLRNMPYRFDRNWDSKSRYSMDWFYPVLTGVINGTSAKQHLNLRWHEFVEPELGCRCVSDEPWITIAESSELTLALLATGERACAVKLYSWLHQWRLDDGSYWTGYQFTQDILWPDEKPTWTAAAVLLAADALTNHTPASTLFTSVNLLCIDENKSINKKNIA